jgi:uncharacterized membrane protein YkvA (DUF1232 family)
MGEDMDPKRRLVSKYQGDMFGSFGMQIRLIVRLLADKRISIPLKALPVFSLIYFISPLDFAIPIVDDVFVLWLANTLFLDLCPQEIVEEHRTDLERAEKRKKAEKIDENDIIDAPYKEKGKG